MYNSGFEMRKIVFSIHNSLFILMIISIVLAGLCSCTSMQQTLEDKIIVDDFSRRKYGWNTWIDEKGSSVSYFQGGLVFIINSPQYDYLSTPVGIFSNIRIEVQAQKLVGPEDNDYGIVCRFQDGGNYYAFLYSSDGYYGIVKVKDHQYQMLTSSSMQFSPLILGKDSTNQLRADCVGAILSMYVNNSMIAQTVDDDFESGKVGLIAGSFKSPGVAILFDNFVVSQQ